MFVVNAIEILNKFCMALQGIKSRIIEFCVKKSYSCIYESLLCKTLGSVMPFCP